MRERNFNLFCLLLVLLISACTEQHNTFKQIPAKSSGLTFTNEITENDTLNILESEFVYNGAGVAMGDLNNDGLQDLFFSGNQVENAAFINQGNLKFIEVTDEANLKKPNPNLWSSGVNLIDINLDGLLDIYVCNTLHKTASERTNLLYINQGIDDAGIPSFMEMGKKYGIADQSHSSHAQFFDYDNDGDLDLFIGVNLIEEKYPNQFVEKNNLDTLPNRDRLYQNNWNESLGHPVFTDVSLEAGLKEDGYSHSTLIHDFNADGWLDIYVANDYQSDDLIFINNQNGTFTNKAHDIFKHYSLSAMGSDLGDINNDGHNDFMTSEMQPYYNKRKKLFQGESSYQREINTRKFNYTYQYTRNTLQLYKGVNKNDLPVYSEIGMFAGVQETDWSWSTLFADFDNDGWQDLYVANGFPKDVTDRDFADFRAFASRLVKKEDLIAEIPEVKSPNFLFKNKGNLKFEDVTKAWNVGVGSFSNGAAYGDLDNDGDLDLVVCNIDDPVFLFENKSNQSEAHYLRIKLKGNKENAQAIGSTVRLYQGDQIQTRNLLSGRGYLSQSESTIHFGLGQSSAIDSVIVTWPSGDNQKVMPTGIDQTLEITHEKTSKPSKNKANVKNGILAASQLLPFKHKEIDFIDFNFQRTIPHKFSQKGPSLNVGDVNGDGLEDLFITGSRKQKQQWFLQNSDGTFTSRLVNYKTNPELLEEDEGSLLFDADNDGDLDLYISRGSGQYPLADPNYQDILLVNDGKGNFSISAEALPKLFFNSSCVKGADYDRDGDIDLFIGSRLLPASYPLADRSYLLRNDSKNGQVKFTEVTETIGKGLMNPGMVNDAIWTDFNNDNWPDLILASEWRPITFFQNQSGKFVDVTKQSGIDKYQGWWTSLTAMDIDNDGDQDYFAGNYGENLYFQCSLDQPLRVYGKDLDYNGSIDPLISCYWRDSLGNKNEYLYHPLQDVIKQFVAIRKKYNSFGEFGEATVPQIFEGIDTTGIIILSANWMKSSWIENKGQGKFEMHALPKEAQLAPIYGMLPIDLDSDGYQDLLMVGNDFGIETQQGRADALNGLVLKNKEGSLEAAPLNDSEFYVPGDARALVRLNHQSSQELIIASQNNDSLKVFSHAVQGEILAIDPNEVKAIIELQNGLKTLVEFYIGTGYYSQSNRSIRKTKNMKSITFYDQLGNNTRTINQ